MNIVSEKALFTGFWTKESKGQISTYLRPMGSTVPQIYGPSGDEP